MKKYYGLFFLILVGSMQCMEKTSSDEDKSTSSDDEEKVKKIEEILSMSKSPKNDQVYQRKNQDDQEVEDVHFITESTSLTRLKEKEKVSQEDLEALAFEDLPTLMHLIDSGKVRLSKNGHVAELARLIGCSEEKARNLLRKKEHEDGDYYKKLSKQLILLTQYDRQKSPEVKPKKQTRASIYSQDEVKVKLLAQSNAELEEQIKDLKNQLIFKDERIAYLSELAKSTLSMSKKDPKEVKYDACQKVAIAIIGAGAGLLSGYWGFG